MVFEISKVENEPYVKLPQNLNFSVDTLDHNFKNAISPGMPFLLIDYKQDLFELWGKTQPLAQWHAK